MSKYIAYTAIALSSFLIAICLIMVPKLYLDISNLHDVIMTEMSEFKFLADDSWNSMMEMKKEHVEMNRPPPQPFSIFSEFVRSKRADGKCRMTIALPTIAFFAVGFCFRMQCKISMPCRTTWTTW